MPEVQEVFQMATQKVLPDPNSLERQHREQQRHVVKQRATVFVLVGALVIGAAVFGVAALRDDPNEGTIGSPPTARPIPAIPDAGTLEPGRYVFGTDDAGLDESYRITMEVPDGFEAFERVAVLKRGTGQTAVDTLAIGEIYADPCRWQETALDPSAISTVDGVVTALASQKGIRVSAPTDVTLDGVSGTYMERTVIRRSDSGCDLARFQVYRGPGGWDRWVEPGQLDLLWILDLDGVPLVVDASMPAGTSAETRAELVRIVGSMWIDLHGRD
jgi:hypothetical protein